MCNDKQWVLRTLQFISVVHVLSAATPLNREIKRLAQLGKSVQANAVHSCDVDLATNIALCIHQIYVHLCS